MNQPFGISIDCSYRLICSRNILKIKGTYDVSDYDNEAIVIKCSGDVICIQGVNLNINSLNADEISVGGMIKDISFNYKEDFS